jgi:pilus assembly protein CpaF
VGEIRGAEAVDVMQAMNTGHAGSMTTIHANSPWDAVTRLETMLLVSDNNIDPHTAERIIAASVDMIIQLDKTGDGQRKISRISEVIFEDDTGGNEKILRIEDIAYMENIKKGDCLAAFTGYEPTFFK